jgi:hypothetical protein
VNEKGKRKKKKEKRKTSEFNFIFFFLSLILYSLLHPNRNETYLKKIHLTANLFYLERRAEFLTFDYFLKMLPDDKSGRLFAHLTHDMKGPAKNPLPNDFHGLEGQTKRDVPEIREVSACWDGFLKFNFVD